MRASPLTMSLIYYALAALLILFAVYHVSSSGWDIWTYLIIAFATTDIVIGTRFFRLHLKIRNINKH